MLLYKLVETADVFLTNFLPDVRSALRIDVERHPRRNPNIIYVRGPARAPRAPTPTRAATTAASFWARGGIADMPSRTAPPERPIAPAPAFGDSSAA